MMILTKGRCDPPFLSQLGFGEGVRGWWVGVLEVLGGLGLGCKEGFGGYLRFRGLFKKYAKQA